MAVEYNRLVRWASLRTVGDSTIREIAHDFARQQQQLVAAVVIIDRDSLIMAKQADVIQGWKDAEAVVHKELDDTKRRLPRAKLFKFLEGIAVGVGVGIILAQ